MWSWPPKAKSSAPAPPRSAARPTPTAARCAPACRGRCPCSTGRWWSYAVRAALALGCTSPRTAGSTGKTTSTPICPGLPDLPALSAHRRTDGEVRGPHRGIHELHMEEDAGKLIHDPWTSRPKCDYNRCGVPLIEIVTEPDFRTAEEVVAYLEWLRETLQYLGVSDCKMQEGSLRCDVNLSGAPGGLGQLGTRTELKNLSSFKAIRRAIYYEPGGRSTRIEAGGGRCRRPGAGTTTRTPPSPCAPRRTPGLPLLPRAGHPASGAVRGIFADPAGPAARDGPGAPARYQRTMA